MLKFRPRPRDAGRRQRRPPASRRCGPVVSPDTAFFWEAPPPASCASSSARDCGALRHPPGPMCPRVRRGQARSTSWRAGTGEVFSYVVHHHPPVPGKRAAARDRAGRARRGRADGRPRCSASSPDQVSIGHAGAGRVPPDRRRADPAGLAAEDRGQDRSLPALPELVIESRPTFVVATALATRDFQAVHHDRDLAVASGSKDIFVNILTTPAWCSGSSPTGPARRPACATIAIRLGVPCYAGDTLTFTGAVTEPRPGDGGDRYRSRSPAGAASATTYATGDVSERPGERRMIAGAAAIAGIGATEFSKDSGRSELRLAVEAVRGRAGRRRAAAGRRRRPGHVHAWTPTPRSRSPASWASAS